MTVSLAYTNSIKKIRNEEKKELYNLRLPLLHHPRTICLSKNYHKNSMQTGKIGINKQNKNQQLFGTSMVTRRNSYKRNSLNEDNR
jgi:hypothetical protein